MHLPDVRVQAVSERSARRRAALALAMAMALGMRGTIPAAAADATPTTGIAAASASAAAPTGSAATSASTVAAATPDEEAATLKKTGDEAMLALRYEDALGAYARSHALRPNPALHYNRARALEALTRYAEALEAYEAFVREAPVELQAKVPGLVAHVAEVRGRTCELSLRVKAAGARVTLRGVVLGTSPLDRVLRVNAGSATLDVVGEGFQPYDKTLELPGGGKLVVDVELVAKDVTAVLALHADPPATVALDGKPLGATPLEASVLPGSHTVTMTRAGYVTRTTTIVVTPNEKKRVDLTLEREAGVLSRWWFWTGVGALAFGAGVTTWQLLKPKDAATGDIEPGRITSPLARF